MFDNSIDLSQSSNESLKIATGKDWLEWILILDAALAFDLKKDQIAARIQAKYKLEHAWAVKIADGYSEAMGLEDKTIKLTGSELTVTLTINASLQLVEQAFIEPALLSSWFRENLSLVKRNPGKNLRFDFRANELITVNFFAKGPAKCQVGLNHSRITDEEALEERKTFWKESLSDLAALVEKS